MKINVAIGQIKPTKGDYDANLGRVGDLFAQIEEEAPETNVLVLPETILSGYFLEGGVWDVARSRDQLFADLLQCYRERVKRRAAALDIVIGFYERSEGRKYYNSGLYATLTSDDSAGVAARVQHVHRKFFLPTYGVFDEKRFVARGRTIRAFDTRFGRVAVLICEDVWHSISATIAALKGAQVIFILSASPGREFSGPHVGNVTRWNVLLPGIADEHNVWVVYAGLVGFEGGKGFTGTSRVIDPYGDCRVIASAMEECLVTATVDLDDVGVARGSSPLLADLESALGDVAIELDEIARKPHQE